MLVKDFSNLGYGCGLRPAHTSHLISQKPTSIDWLEALAENYLDWSDGRQVSALENLENLRNHYPIALHGVSLSLGSTDPLDREHLKRLAKLIHRIEPAWFSDHLCWTGVDGKNLHDLFPLPYTEEAIRHVVENICRTQDFLGQRILIENVSSYVTFASSQMPEWEFLCEIARRSDCGLLLDINNVYVSSRNHGFNPKDYLDAIPIDRIGQIHLAGHRDKGDHLIDTHDAPVCEAVWELYRDFTAAKGPFTTMIEWDDAIPPWERMEEEVRRARTIGGILHVRTDSDTQSASTRI